MTPFLDEFGGITYNKTSSSCNLFQADKTAHRRGGRVMRVDGANNVCVSDFFAGSQVEQAQEAMLRAERTTYKQWKLEHNCAQVFC